MRAERARLSQFYLTGAARKSGPFDLRGQLVRSEDAIARRARCIGAKRIACYRSVHDLT